MDESATDYNGAPQEKQVAGFQRMLMEYETVGGTFDETLFTGTDAGTYTITFRITDNNYTWSEGGETDPL